MSHQYEEESVKKIAITPLAEEINVTSLKFSSVITKKTNRKQTKNSIILLNFH